MKRVLITAFGYFDDSGLGGSGETRPAIPLDELTWQRVSPEPFKRFGQLDAISKCALAAIEAGGLREQSSGDTAICGATADGCLGADIEFLQSAAGETGPSPRLFAYTLPSTICGEIAIRYSWTGPNICLLTRDSLDALFEGYYQVASGESPSCVSVGYNAMFAQTAATAEARGLRISDNAPEAHAFLLQPAGTHSRTTGWTLSPEKPEAQRVTPVESSLRNVKDFMINAGDSETACAELRSGREQKLYLYHEAYPDNPTEN